METARLRRASTVLWSQWVRPMAVVLLVLFTFRSAVADWHHVPTGSMEPNILPGDRIVVSKLAYDVRIPFAGWSLMKTGEPARGEVVTCFAPDDGTRLVKRVIGVPGDRIEMRDGRLRLNGASGDYQPTATSASVATVEESIDGATHTIQFGSRSVRRNLAAMTIPRGQYLVLGDNRDNSKDSRSFGLIPRDEITGRVLATAFSLNPGHAYLPRWERTFKRMH